MLPPRTLLAALMVLPLGTGACDACDDEGPRQRDAGGAEEPRVTAEAAAIEPERTPVPIRDPLLPGIDDPDEALERELRAADATHGEDAHPREWHAREDGSPRYVNRLVLEQSPYLRQHAHNPVNWFPWGDEALARALRENKPILLSIGFSTCHWCHVMERESFEDPEIAEYLNRSYIAIKVDRDERPDVDTLYTRLVELIGGGGGWPLTALLTPQAQPFFGASYIPPDAHARDGEGFLDLLQTMRRRFDEHPAELRALARDAHRRLEAASHAAPAAELPTAEALARAARGLALAYDPVHGGFGRAPRFPRASQLSLLLRYHRRTGDPAALRMVEHSLDQMAAGGLHDHVGGGFHRYAADPEWAVPHFEKMLYDQALLAILYLEAYRATGRIGYRELARETLEYVDRDLGAPEGGFHSATDADSASPDGRMEEGRFYTWTEAELVVVLGPVRARRLAILWDARGEGEVDGRHVLRVPRPVAEVAEELGTSEAALRSDLTRGRAALLAARSRRPPPARDDAVITAWNALAISAFARGAFTLDDASIGQRAERACTFLLEEARDDGGHLLRAAGNDQPAFLEDHAYLVQALLDLHELTGETRWLREAVTLQETQNGLFEDTEGGGFFMTSSRSAPLPVRDKPAEDRLLPSGNAISAQNLFRLGVLTGEPAHRERAERTLGAFRGHMQAAGASVPSMLAALDWALDEPLEVAVVLPDGLARQDRGPASLLSPLRRSFYPNAVRAVLSAASVEPAARSMPWLAEKLPLDGQPTAYVCVRGRCDEPTSDPAVLTRQLTRARRRLFPSGPPAPLQLPRPRGRGPDVPTAPPPARGTAGP